MLNGIINQDLHLSLPRAINGQKYMLGQTMIAIEQKTKSISRRMMEIFQELYPISKAESWK